MKLPNGITEDEFMSAMAKIMERIKKKYSYVVHDGDDLAQEAYFIGIKVCESYKKESGPLYNFLSVAVTNRIRNFLRDKSIKEVSYTYINDDEEDTVNMIGNMKTTNDEFWETIDEHLQAKFRHDYLKLRQGIDIPKVRKMNLITELKRIVNEYI